MLDGGWKKTNDFPLFKLSAAKLEIADLRLVDKKDWVLKIYNSDSRWVKNKEESKKQSTEEKRIEIFDLVQTHEVWIARWWGEHSVLELRLPQIESKQDLKKSFADFENMLSPITGRDYSFLNLTLSANYIVQNEDEFNGRIKSHAALYNDEIGGKIKVTPRDPDESIHASEKRTETINKLSDCDELVAFWCNLGENDTTVPKTFRVLFGKLGKHSLLVTSNLKSTAVNYATKQILQIQKKCLKQPAS